MSQVPQVEQRGGDKPDWASVVAGEPLPELPKALIPLQPDEDGCEQWYPDEGTLTRVRMRPVTEQEEQENNW